MGKGGKCILNIWTGVKYVLNGKMGVEIDRLAL